eukprot:gene15133-21189_t
MNKWYLDEIKRVVQNHLAAANNVGSVASKEEVWEVVGQLTGYAASVLVLQVLESSGSNFYTLAAAWAAIHGVHVVLRYKALKQLSFPTLSQKRACMLTSAHTSGQPLPGVAELNLIEPIWAPASAVKPVVKLGCSLRKAFGEGFEERAGVISLDLQQPAKSSSSDLTQPTDSSSSDLQHPANGSSSELGDGTGPFNAPSTSGRSAEEELKLYFKLYKQEQYILVWRDSKAYVVLKEEAEPKDILRSVWQAAWLSGHAKERLHILGGGLVSVNGNGCRDLRSRLGADVNATPGANLVNFANGDLLALSFCDTTRRHIRIRIRTQASEGQA